MSHIPASATLVHRADRPLDWNKARLTLAGLGLADFDGFIGEVEGTFDQLDELLHDVTPANSDGPAGHRLLAALHRVAASDLELLAADLDSGEEWDTLRVGGYVVRLTEANLDVTSETLARMQRLDELTGVLAAAGFLDSEEYKHPI